MRPFKSIEFDLETQKESILDSQNIAFSASESLTTLRGQAFFTSAFTIKNKHGIALVSLELHYERFQRCYRRLFERSDFPLSYTQFKALVDKTIALNSACTDPHMHCLIFATAGSPREINSPEGQVYSSGFGGHLKKITVVLKRYTKKPDWCYESGVNLISMPHQRPLASAKPTNYAAGIQGQHQCDAINTAAIYHAIVHKTEIQASVSEMITVYQSLSIQEATGFRLLMHDLFAQPERSAQLTKTQLNTQYGLSQNLIERLHWLCQCPISETVFQHVFKTVFKSLCHDVIFTSSDAKPYVLEGSTFSLMGLNQDDEVIFIPLEGNSTSSDDLNTGYVLESTSIALLQNSAKSHNIPYKISPLHLSELHTLKALYTVSTTRLRFEENQVLLQPVATLDGQPLQKVESATVTQLTQKLRDYIDAYIPESNPVPAPGLNKVTL